MKHRIVLTALVATAAVGFAGCTSDKPVETTTPAPATTSATVAAPSSPASAATPSTTATASPAPATATSSPVTVADTPTVTATAPTTSAPAPAPAPAEWTNVASGRFGFTAPVPGGWQVSGDPANSDGFTASGPAGASVTYSGANVLTDPNVAGPCPQIRQQLVNRGVALSYASETADGCVYSGTQGDTIVYERQWVGQGSRVGMTWTYPAAQADAINPMVERAGNELVPGNLGVAH